MSSLAEVITRLSDISLLLATFIAVKSWRAMPVYGKLIATQVILACLTEATGIGLTLLGFSNLIIYNLYMVAEFLLLTAAVHQIRPTRALKAWLTGAGCVYLTVWLGYLILEKPGTLLNKPYILGCLILAAAYLWQVIQMQRYESADRYTLFLIYAILFFFSCIIPVLWFRGFLLNMDGKLAETVAIIIPLLNIIRYNLTSAANLLYLKKGTSLQA